MLKLEEINNIEKSVNDKPVLITDDLTISWLDYKNLVKSNLFHLLKNGIINSKTTRAIVISENSWKEFILFSCLNTASIVNSGIDYTMNMEKQISAIESSESNLVFYSSNSKFIDEMKNELDDKVKFFNIEKLIKESLACKVTIEELKDLVRVLNHHDNITGISFTSGTTGLPKCIYRTKIFFKERAKIFEKKYHFNTKDIFLVTMPFYHVSVKGWAKLILVNGGTLVFGNFERSNDLALKIMNYNITSMLITPPVLNRLLPLLRDNDFNNKTVKFIMVGGKNFPIQLKSEAISVFGPVVNEYYGSSETGINTLADSAQISRFPSSSGTMMKGSKIIILDKNNQIKSNNSIGRVAINSFQCAAGYLGRKMKDIYFENERYIITEDYGWINDNGYVFITQRLLADGNNVTINVFELENILRSLRNVEDVAIVQEESDDYDIFVQASDDLSDLDTNILKYTINKILDGFNVSSEINFVDVINYSLSGKVKYIDMMGDK